MIVNKELFQIEDREILVRFIHGKERWLEVVAFNEEGYPVSVSYEAAEVEE